MDGVEVIDCRVIANNGPVYGLLAGAESKDGLWSIDLITRSGYKQLISSQRASAEAVVSAERLLTGAAGIMDKNCHLRIDNGVILLFDRESCWEIFDGDRQHYVEKVAAEFIDFLVTRFEQSNYGWIWRDPRREAQGRYGSIRDALVKYHWPIRRYFGASPYFASGADFASNSALLADLQSRLRLATQKANETLALQICKDVQIWGGTDKAPRGGGNLQRLEEISAGNGLVAYLTSLEKSLKTCDETGKFLERRGFVSNAGFTKIYSLYFADFIIYDSRVAAVLGAFLAEWARNGNVVADSLRLMWMPPNEGQGISRPKLRNPSTTEITFQQATDRKAHFVSNVRANWILSSVANRLDSPGIWPLHNRLRALEAALFMMGHDLAGNAGYPVKENGRGPPVAMGANSTERAVLVRRPASKMRKAKQIYQRLRARGCGRTEIIAEFVRAIPMTKAGASTYYQSVKNVE